MNPSTTTSVLLSSLPNTLVESKLKEEVAKVNCRKVQLEPGCAFHFTNECEAKVAAELVKSKYNVEAIVSRASMPCIELHNIPEDVNADALFASFAKQNPLSVHLSGTASPIQIDVCHESDAVKALVAISKVTVNGQNLKASATKVNQRRTVVSVSNIPADSKAEEIENAINNALKSANLEGTSKITQVTSSCGPSVTVRFPYTASISEASVTDALNKNSPGAFKVRQVCGIRKPALFLRKVSHLKDQSMESLLGSDMANVERLVFLRPSEHRRPDMVVAYFNSEDSAFECARKIHNKVVDGSRVSAVYRAVSEPAVKIANIPESVTAEDIKAFTSAVDVLRIDYIQGQGFANIIVGSPNVARMAQKHLSYRNLAGNVITAEIEEVQDVGVEIESVDKTSISAEVISSALNGLDVKPKGMSFRTNALASVGFLSVDDAHSALDTFMSGAVEIKSSKTSSNTSSAGSMVASMISTLPTYVTQVMGLSPETPVKAVMDDVDAQQPGMKMVKVDRKALLKFRRHRDVVPGMKELRATAIEGQNIQVDKYRPLRANGETEYDETTGKLLKKQVAFEKFSISGVMKDIMHLDPAARYQIAKNKFNRTLVDCRASGEIDMLFDEDLMNPGVKEEVQHLFDKTGFAAELDDLQIDQRLFKIFIQTEQMAKMTKDFQEMTMLNGPPDESDPFNWSQYELRTGEDMERLNREMLAADEAALEEMFGKGGATKRNAHASLGTEAGGSLDFDSDSDSELDMDAIADETTAAMKRAKKVSVEGATEQMTEGKPKKLKAYNVDDMTKAEKERFFSDPEGNKLNCNIDEIGGTVVDLSGNIWSLIDVDSDLTQKTMPGGRMMSYRSLVVLGNLKGTGGFGIGKGKTPMAAYNAAIRNSLRNLVHIDLYDNAALAHDLYGKHNSCHCYIRATPVGREMVASPLVTEILNRFGIASASVKMIGNRNPYSQVNALFNALSHHVNIDEYARDRGQRYLTLRWARDRGI